MDTPEKMKTQATTHRRKGQTLAEFAITLPILLILVFGVIEFGRIFQAWVTLQNSARTAARYASTGSYDRVLFPLNDTGVDDPDSAVPCVYDDLRGTETTVNPNGDGNLINVYSGDIESLFATWWDGRNCNPGIPDHQDMRKDIVRILSIYNEARRGAAGLAIGPSSIQPGITYEGVAEFLYDVWYRPLPGAGQHYFRQGSDRPSWFDVMVCSSRPVMNEFSNPKFPLGSRFATILDSDDGAPFIVNERRAPVCIFNEDTPADSGSLNNTDHPVPWLDAGSAGDSVTVVVMFNHPLITPLGLAEYIPLQARRVVVNEAFRVADATRALDAVPPGSGINRPPVANAGPDQTITDTAGLGTLNVSLNGSASFDPDVGDYIVSYIWTNAQGLQIATGVTPTIQLPSPGVYIFTLTVTDTFGATDSDTVTITLLGPEPTDPPPPTLTPVPPTPTPAPFSCDLLRAGDLSFSGNRVYIVFYNDNIDSTELTRARLNWRLVPAFPTMYVYTFALDNIIHWAGQDSTPPTDTNADPSTPPDLFINADRTVPGESIMVWEAVFAAGPTALQNFMTVYDFGGTLFTFRNPEGGFCEIPLNLPEPTPVPTFDPAVPSPTPSYTPDCASDQIMIRFVEFMPFGVVKLEVVNLRPVVGILLDFRINWIQRSPGILTLDRVTVGGNSPADTTTPTIRVWESGSPTQDANPPTNGRGEGTWLTNYTFPPQSITPIYLDFGGTTTTVQTAFNAARSDYNGSWFEINCDTTGGGGGGGGGGQTGIINLAEEDPPTPTPTRGPTNTPRPTFTPSRTPLPVTPSNTPIPPPSRTPGPTNTPRPTDPVVFPTPTPFSGSGGDSGG